MGQSYIFTSESVTEGHPDKVADAISDSVVDAILKVDGANGRVACETMVSTGMAVISGEISTSTYVDIPALARKTILEIGYDSSDCGFDGHNCAVLTSIDEQSGDIAQGVDRDSPDAQGAGDQGLMFGYASNETASFMPAPIHIAHRMAERLAAVRKDGSLSYLRPDGKTQVSIRYEGDKPVAVDTVVLSTQHAESATLKQIQSDMVEHVVRPILEDAGLDFSKVTYHINPTGRFVKGGPQADCGLTGRKIIVDTYGGMGRHGGGAFSGKDPSKVDRSAAYAARHVAKNLVAAGAAERLELQLAYAIGVAQPVSIHVDSFGTSKVDDAKLDACVRDLWNLSPAGIISSLDLHKPRYRNTAAYGHFGREGDSFIWEQLNRVADVKAKLGL